MTRMTRERHERAGRRNTVEAGGVPARVTYRGYDILPQAEGAIWAAWILLDDIPAGRVSGKDSPATALAAAKAVIDRRDAGYDRR